MAWVSVHEKLIGPKLRELAKEIGTSQNEAIGILIRMWLWALNEADTAGALKYVDGDDIKGVLANGLVKDTDTETVLNGLISTGWLEMVDGSYYIHDWEDWQKQWYRLQDVKEKNKIRQQKFRDNHRGEKAKKPTPKQTVEDNEEPEKTEKKSSGYTKDFEEFWQIYPRKVGKGEAYKKYKARLNDGFSEAELLEAATNYARKCASEHTEEKYIKHGKTFLSEATPFTDYISSRQEAKATAYPTGYQDDGSNPYR